ncbi:GDP-mannose mannosyl hydrolase [Methylobacillus sp.]|uniref:GDP-mannose mannosyl hydrolase n=1 Tax=Methylobacillus sp. TaxID=56818 RepID=UPI002FDFC40C
MKKQHFAREQFLSLVDTMPLVSVDFIVEQHGKILLGKRNNRPAQGCWFVPGGRIFKGEKIVDAMVRILDKELSLGTLLTEAKVTPEFQGVYQHFYGDCFAGDIGVSTHYIVLGHRLHLDGDINLQSHDDQHGELAWWSVDELLGTTEVHQYTKDYFLK